MGEVFPVRAHLHIAARRVRPAGPKGNLAIYSLSVRAISRKTGKNAVAAAAYRAGELLRDGTTGTSHDYTTKAVVARGIIAPENAPAWVMDRERLWNTVEMIEKRKDARVARDFTIAIPNELTHAQGEQLVRGWIKDQLVDRKDGGGMVADYALHEGDGGKPNLHAHVMVTTRTIDANGFGKKERAWDKRELLGEWRKSWEIHANRALERAGVTQRIDHRSYAERGIDRMPTIHLGPATARMEERGELTDRGDYNRTAALYNRQRERDHQQQRERDIAAATSIAASVATPVEVKKPIIPTLLERLRARDDIDTVNIAKERVGISITGKLLDVDDDAIAIEGPHRSATIVRVPVTQQIREMIGRNVNALFERAQRWLIQDRTQEQEQDVDQER